MRLVPTTTHSPPSCHTDCGRNSQRPREHLRISHTAISGRNAGTTIHFHTRVLGMELLLHEPNLDYEPEEHLFFHAGNDNFSAYFVPMPGVDPTSRPRSRGRIGHTDGNSASAMPASTTKARSTWATSAPSTSRARATSRSNSPADRWDSHSETSRDPCWEHPYFPNLPGFPPAAARPNTNPRSFFPPGIRTPFPTA